MVNIQETVQRVEVPGRPPHRMAPSADRRSRGPRTSGPPAPHRVLFVDVADSTLGPMAVAFARQVGLVADSVGTMPAHEVSQGAVLAMQEKGVGLEGRAPRRIDFLRLAEYERIIALEDGVAATSPDLHPHEEWHLEDPANLEFALYRKARDAIEERVRELGREILEWSAPQEAAPAPAGS